MSDVVKGNLKSGGGGRGLQARATRRRIVDAGAALFIANGYAATTLEQIADRAGVAVQTVYFHFGNKRTVLKQAVDIAAVGDDEPAAVLDRPWMERAGAEADPERVIALWARHGREIFTRIAPIMRVVRDAAGADQDMATQWQANEEQRLTAFGVLARMLADRGGLKPAVTVDEATDIIFALLGIELYLVFAARGWTSAHWEQWTIATLTATLLR
jgi:AcrR family transcriptional regulator